MISHLKKAFIPHEHNDYRPHFWRPSALYFVVLFIIATFVSAVLLARAVRDTGVSAQVLPVVLTKLANEDRAAQGVAPLTENALLVQSATLKGEDMRDGQYFAHTSPTGLSPWSWFQKVGYNFFYAGENLAVHFTESNAVESAWLSSPSHRKNLLDSRFTDIGIATVDGMYQGVPTTFVVQHFGTPAVKKVGQQTVLKQTESKSLATNVRGAQAVEEPVKVIASDPQTEVVQTTDTTVAPQIAPLAAPDTHVTFAERIVVDPSAFLKLVYLFVGAIILVALLLFVFIEIRKQHLPSVVAGVALLAGMCGAYYLFIYFIGQHFVFV